MKRLAQGALIEDDLTEELLPGKTVDFPGGMKLSEERITDGENFKSKDAVDAEKTTESFTEDSEAGEVEDASKDSEGEETESTSEGSEAGEAENDSKDSEAEETESVSEGSQAGEAEKFAEAQTSAKPGEPTKTDNGGEGDPAQDGAEWQDVEEQGNESQRFAEKTQEPYFGSVKFFKNMILVAVAIAIAVPTVLAVAIWRHGEAAVSTMEGEQAQLNTALEDLQTRYDQLAADKQAEEAIWGGSVAGQVVQTEPLDYQTHYPDFYVDAPMGALAQDDKTMYLTFDDGPSSNTPLLLSILRSKDVKATFFVVGGDTERQRQWMRDIVADGNALGMHSYTHNYHEIYESVESFLDDYYQLFSNIKEATGQAPTIFRFPGGSVNSYNYPVYREIVAEMLRRGFVFYDWNLSSGDASSNYISPKRITDNILNNSSAFSRGIVLFHDAPSKDSTVEALGGVIDGLREQGYNFAPLSREVRPMLFNYTDYQPD